MNIYDVVATDGQVVFDLPFFYTPGSNELFVFWQGQLLFKDVSYTETTSTRVTLLFPAQAGDEFVFRIPAGSFTGFQAPVTFGFAPRLPRPEAPPDSYIHSMNLAVKIELPLTFPDDRADKFKIYKVLPNGQVSVLQQVGIGTQFAIDINTNFGVSYYFTAVDSVSGNESTASPIARIFRKRSTTPYVA